MNQREFISLLGRVAGVQSRSPMSLAFLDEIIRAGTTSHNAIAAKLNERNVRTARGGTWIHVQVGAILHPFDGASVAAV